MEQLRRDARHAPCQRAVGISSLPRPQIKLLEQSESVDLGWMQRRKMRVCVQPETDLMKFGDDSTCRTCKILCWLSVPIRP